MLQSFDLQINQNQTEEHAIPYPYKPPALNEHNYSQNPGKNEWKTCKLLGSYIDSETDIKRRRILLINGICYPKIINNEDLYRIIKEIPWSQTIKERRHRFLGHLCRLPENTPARQSLCETLRPYTKKCGRPKLTWIEQVRNELKDNGLTSSGSKFWKHYKWS